MSVSIAPPAMLPYASLSYVGRASAEAAGGGGDGAGAGSALDRRLRGRLLLHADRRDDRLRTVACARRDQRVRRKGNEHH